MATTSVVARKPRLSTFLSLFIFGMAAAFFWWLLPPEPRYALPTNGNLNFAGFSPDAKLFATVVAGDKGNSQGPVRLWDVVSGRERSAVAVRLPVSEPLTFSPDSKLLAAVGADDRCEIWDVEPSVKRFGLAPASSIVFSADSQFLAAYSNKAQKLQIWDLSANRQTLVIDAVPSFALSPNSKTIALAETANESNNRAARLKRPGQLVRLRDMATGQIRQTLPGRADSISSLVFSGGGRWLAALTRSMTPPQGKEGLEELFQKIPGQIFLWDLAAPKEPYFHKPVAMAAGNLRFVADELLQDRFSVWDLTAKPPRRLGMSGTLLSLHGALLELKMEDKSLCLQEFPSKSERWRVDLGNYILSMHVLDVAGDSRFALVKVEYFKEHGDYLRHIRGVLRDLLPGRPVRDPDMPETELKFFDMERGDVAATLDQLSHIAPAPFSPDGRTLVVQDKYALQLWDVPPRTPWVKIVTLAIVPAATILLISLLWRWKGRRAKVVKQSGTA